MDSPAAIALKWRIYLRLGRVSNLPTVWTNALAGAVLSGAAIEAHALLGLITVFSLYYTAGMFLNDAFDRDWDARERPERPIPAGMIGPAEVFLLGYGMLAAASAALFFWRGDLHWKAGLSGLILSALIVTYDAWHKENPLSPVLMGVCRMMVYVTAALALADIVSPGVIAGALLILSYLIGLSYVAKQETLTEYRNFWPLLFLFAPFAYTFPALAGNASAALLYAGFAAWVIYSISLLRRKPPRIHQSVVNLIAGVSLLDALLIAAHGQTLTSGLCLLAFSATLYLQRYVKGT